MRSSSPQNHNARVVRVECRNVNKCRCVVSTLSLDCAHGACPLDINTIHLKEKLFLKDGFSMHGFESSGNHPLSLFVVLLLLLPISACRLYDAPHRQRARSSSFSSSCVLDLLAFLPSSFPRAPCANCFGHVGHCPYTNTPTQYQVCHHRLHSENFNCSRDDRPPYSAQVQPAFSTNVSPLCRGPSSCIRSTSLRALLPNPNPRAHPRSHRRGSTPASPTSPSPLRSSVCMPSFTFSSFLSGSPSSWISPRRHIALSSRRQDPETRLLRSLPHFLVFFLSDLLWFDCCAVDRLRFLAQFQTFLQCLAMFVTCPVLSNFFPISKSRACHVFHSHLGVVPFAHPRPHLPQLRLRGCEREVVAMVEYR